MRERTRNKQIKIRVDEDEYDAIENLYLESGESSKRDFFVKMLLKGYIVRVDLSKLNKVAEELNKIGVNINQIAHRVNSDNVITNSELKELRQNMYDINYIIQKEFIKYKRK